MALRRGDLPMWGIMSFLLVLVVVCVVGEFLRVWGEGYVCSLRFVIVHLQSGCMF